MRKILLAFSFVLAIVQLTQAQYRCGTDIMYNKAKARNPFLVEAERSYEQMIQEGLLELGQNRDGELEAVLVIPMVFHILHMNGPENISDAQILDAMRILNEDYNKLNADTIVVVSHFDTLIANVRLEFRLATKDFEGNCTNGIERIYTTEAYVGDNGSKISQWPRERYLNVWTAARIGVGGAAGYSQYPSAVIDTENAKADGVILLHDYIGSIGTGTIGKSRALTHEIGHYLDLQHTWGSTNDPEVECGDDGVLDTPETAGHDNCTTLYDMQCTNQGLNNTTQNVNLTSKYSFDDVTTTSGTTDPSDAPPGTLFELNQERLGFGAMHASGVSSNSNEFQKFSFTNWGTGAPDGATSIADCTGAVNTNDYYEFTITPTAGTLFTLNSLTFEVGRNETGPRSFSVRTSLNDYGTNLKAAAVASAPLLTNLPAGSNSTNYFINQDTAVVITGCRFDFASGASNAYTNLYEPLTIRIYGWNAEDASGSFSIDDLSLNGIFGVNENIQNYMEYSYCSSMFTKGQKARMRTALASSISGRSNLYTESNRLLTGTDDGPHTPCPPKADFYAESIFTCHDDQIQFRDNSTNGTVNSWLWTFEDGNPSQSTEQNPSVSFNSYGRKTITLTVINDHGSSTETKIDYVVVAPEGSEVPTTLYQEGFDSAYEFYTHWVSINHDGNLSTFQQTNVAGLSNNTSAVLNAYIMDVTQIDEGGNDIDELVSPMMDLSNISGNGEVTFDFAFATQSVDQAGISDLLQVYISKDCGASFNATGSLRYSSDSLDLVTAGNSSVFFIPSSSLDWKNVSFSIPGSFLGPGFRMKFVFRTGLYPNNFYIDNVNINGTLLVDDTNSDFYGANLFPNPTEGSTTLSYFNSGSTKIDITLTDMSGRIVERWSPNNNTPGKQVLEIGTDELAKGLYMVNMKSDRNSSTMKLIVR